MSNRIDKRTIGQYEDLGWAEQEVKDMCLGYRKELRVLDGSVIFGSGLDEKLG